MGKSIATLDFQTKLYIVDLKDEGAHDAIADHEGEQPDVGEQEGSRLPCALKTRIISYLLTFKMQGFSIESRHLSKLRR